MKNKVKKIGNKLILNGKVSNGDVLKSPKTHSSKTSESAIGDWKMEMGFFGYNIRKRKSLK